MCWRNVIFEFAATVPRTQIRSILPSMAVREAPEGIGPDGDEGEANDCLRAAGVNGVTGGGRLLLAPLLLAEDIWGPALP